MSQFLASMMFQAWRRATLPRGVTKAAIISVTIKQILKYGGTRESVTESNTEEHRGLTGTTTTTHTFARTTEKGVWHLTLEFFKTVLKKEPDGAGPGSFYFYFNEGIGIEEFESFRTTAMAQFNKQFKDITITIKLVPLFNVPVLARLMECKTEDEMVRLLNDAHILDAITAKYVTAQEFKPLLPQMGNPVTESKREELKKQEIPYESRGKYIDFDFPSL